MKSTPIGVAIQSPMPMLYPQQTEPLQPQVIHLEPIGPAKTGLYPPTDTALQPTIEPPNIEPNPTHTESTSQNTILDLNYEENLISPDLEQGELYAEYLTNPYNGKEINSKETTLYDPESPIHEPTNPLLSVDDKQKSYSANATPLHGVKAQFGSSDNVSLRQESSIFNFSSYFGAVNEKSGGEFDSLMPAHEG